jgi:hypothetical protein
MGGGRSLKSHIAATGRHIKTWKWQLVSALQFPEEWCAPSYAVLGRKRTYCKAVSLFCDFSGREYTKRSSTSNNERNQKHDQTIQEVHMTLLYS